jgi:hypothetical protein
LTPDGKLSLISDFDGGKLVVLDASTKREFRRMKLGRSPEGILVARQMARALSLS